MALFVLIISRKVNPVSVKMSFLPVQNAPWIPPTSWKGFNIHRSMYTDTETYPGSHSTSTKYTVISLGWLPDPKTHKLACVIIILY